MNFQRKELDDAFLLQLYKDLLFPRMIEEKMLVLLRQGKISKWFSGIGQEAIAVGITSALEEEDYILPLHRNLGVFTTRGLPLNRLIAQWQGKANGYTQGRDRSFHFADLEKKIIGMVSHLGAMLPVADGLALAAQIDKKNAIAVPFIGDGGTSEGDVHEAINVAATWGLPVLFVIENNGYGLSTPISEQFKNPKLSERAEGYGIKGYTIDGNNVLEVYHVVKALRKQILESGQPIILECNTFRMRGHEEASGTKYIPQEYFEEWKEKDPVQNFHSFLLKEGVISAFNLPVILESLKNEIIQSVDEAFNGAEVSVSYEKELGEVFAGGLTEWVSPNGQGNKEMRFVDAIQDSLRSSMERFPELVLMGQDIAEYGGVFKITEGFVDRFGKERVRNTPLCESAIIGAGMGLSLGGKRAMVEMQFADFVSCGFNQIVNNLAKTYYRWGHAPNVVVRMPTGGSMGAGPFHSQSIESWFTHVPGLKVVFPSNPRDAKGLLNTAIADPNPVIYFEHKALYRSESGEVPVEYYQLPFGKAKLIQEGEDVTIITYGLGVKWALAVSKELKDHPIEILDLRTLIPWDQEAVKKSVEKCGKCVVLYEATATSAFGAEIAAFIAEECFQYLDGPVVRLGSLDTPVPFNKALEAQFLPTSRLKQRLEELLAY